MAQPNYRKLKNLHWICVSLLVLGVISILFHSMLLHRWWTNLSTQLQQRNTLEDGDDFTPLNFWSGHSVFAKQFGNLFQSNDTNLKIHPPIDLKEVSMDKELPTFKELAKCEPTGNLMFLKTHKTAGTTLQTVLNRYGYFHRSSMVFFKKNFKNGHLRYIKLNKDSPKKDFLPCLNKRSSSLKFKGYNMSTGHILYNRKVMDTFMAEKTKYITVLREPSSQWISAFHHLGLENILRRIDNGRFQNYTVESLMELCMRNPSICITIEGEKSPLLPLYKNNQMYDLGQDTNNNTALIEGAIKQLSEELDLVLIADYFDESMVLLKNLMCWDYNDIVYAAKNRVPDHIATSPTLREKIRNFNKGDTMLYDHFNRTFWTKIKSLGENFSIQLRIFREVQRQKFEECAGRPVIIVEGGFEHFEYLPKEEATEFCRIMFEDHNDLFRRLFHRQMLAYGFQ